LGGQTANIGAVPIKLDTPHHHFDVLFVQTGCHAMFARGYTFITGFEATFVLMRWHHVFSLLVMSVSVSANAAFANPRIIRGAALVWGTILPGNMGGHRPAEN
jgi:hypothetical protein